MPLLFVFLLFSGPLAGTLQITTSSVPAATQYQTYNTTLSATGGTAPYAWSVVSSTSVSLPEGMSLDPSSGVISAKEQYEAWIYLTEFLRRAHGRIDPSVEKLVSELCWHGGPVSPAS